MRRNLPWQRYFESMPLIAILKRPRDIGPTMQTLLKVQPLDNNAARLRHFYIMSQASEQHTASALELPAQFIDPTLSLSLRKPLRV